MTTKSSSYKLNNDSPPERVQSQRHGLLLVVLAFPVDALSPGLKRSFVMKELQRKGGLID